MADTIETWAERIDGQKENEDLIIVNTPSRAGGWKLWKDIVSLGARTLERIFEKKIEDYQDEALARSPHYAAYYRGLSLAYQSGDSLVFLGNRYGYLVIDTSKQVVNVCQVQWLVSGGLSGVSIHPGFKDANGDIAILGAVEYAAFQSYLEELKPCGRRISYSALPVGNFIVEVEIFYDPVKMNADGSLFADPTTFPVVDAIKDYQDNVVNTEASFIETELRKRLYDIDAVADIDYTRTRWDANGGTTYTDISTYNSAIFNLAQYNKAGTPLITYTSI